MTALSILFAFFGATLLTDQLGRPDHLLYAALFSWSLLSCHCLSGTCVLSSMQHSYPALRVGRFNAAESLSPQLEAVIAQSQVSQTQAR